MTDDRKNIKIPQDRFKELKDGKPEGMTWGYYLTEYRTPDE